MPLNEERRVSPLLRSLVLSLARPRILPESRQVRGGSRPVRFVLATNAAADRVVLEDICRKQGLPEFEVQESILCLERWRGFLRDRLDRRLPASLRALVAAAIDNPSYDVDLVPVSLFWGRAPDKEHSWLRLPFAETWRLSGWLRRALAVLINGRNLVVQFAEPVSLREIIAAAPEQTHAERRVARTCRTLLYRQRAATLGPEFASRSTMLTQVLRTQAVRRGIRSEMRAKNLTRRQAVLLAKSYLDEIAADYSHVVVNLLERVLRRVWNRLYDGVELHNLENLQAVIEDHEVVYVPCHRSHMDYLLLSYVIYQNGFAIPHIAAGLNLNMPVVGRVLRKGGAFFIRRSFAGNALYTVIFNKYLGLMMARGHAIEYFIEGGRSRTGRLLQPKTGALTMTVRSYLRDPRRPVAFVPVYFGYERLVEARTYIGELSGKPKQTESVLGMLRTLPALRQRFGKVHVSLGEPIKLADILAAHAPDWQATAEADEKPQWLGKAVDDLALRIMRNINSAACVTPVNLLALTLLATPKQAMLEGDLIRQVELYASLLRSAPYSPHVSITRDDGARMVRYGESLGILLRRPHPMGDVLQMSEDNAVLMTYFRNNLLHLLAIPSAIACCFLNNRAMRTDDIQRLAWRIYPYLCDELFLPWPERDLPRIVQATLDDLTAHGLIQTLDEGASWTRPQIGSVEAVQLSLLAQITVQIIQRYYLAIALLLKGGSGRLSQDTLEQQCQLMAQRMSLLYELDSPEFFDRSLFKNFIDLLRARNVLGVNAEGRLTFTEMLLAVSDDAELVLHEQIRNSVLQVTHR